MKTIGLIIAVLLLSGCAAMQSSGWYEHRTQWASWEHMKFSVTGYQNPDIGDYLQSETEPWWGQPYQIYMTR